MAFETNIEKKIIPDGLIQLFHNCLGCFRLFGLFLFTLHFLVILDIFTNILAAWFVFVYIGFC